MHITHSIAEGKMAEQILLAVNGTLMRGLALNGNLLAVGARFEGEAMTAPCYRLWAIGDRHPAMERVEKGGGAIALEIWSVPTTGIAQILQQEPPGLCIGKIELSDSSQVLGVLGEHLCCQRGKEITQFGGWRAYCASLSQGNNN